MSTVLGICVSIGNTTGFIVPYITGLLTEKKNTLQQWSYCFYISGVVGLVTGLCFQLFASAEVQDWGLERSDDAPATEVSELKSIKNTIPKEVNGSASHNGHPRTSL
ncbi:hypothetical protein HPB47_012894 [Ixodes persulcatus]|uniref:Uncharacterized protein n=1 Tax=Ixodes persulcatus TaxID=34615 RepID=A0AC60NSA8_IXOPE|nr:hypothetical protein HPB47_012894 [Ixodes persulcatus]